MDYAHVLKDLADVHFANAKTIVLVQDNLNIHSKASLYEAFPAAEARRLVERFEWHYTPKHGSWLDLAESELGVLSSQCLDRRIPDKQTLVEEIAAWEHDRNASKAKANWHFTTPNARIKLKHPGSLGDLAHTLRSGNKIEGVTDLGRVAVSEDDTQILRASFRGAKMPGGLPRRCRTSAVCHDQDVLVRYTVYFVNLGREDVGGSAALG